MREIDVLNQAPIAARLARQGEALSKATVVFGGNTGSDPNSPRTWSESAVFMLDAMARAGLLALNNFTWRAVVKRMSMTLQKLSEPVQSQTACSVG